MLLNPKTETYEHLDARSREIMLKTIAFFANRGKRKLKEDYHGQVWYADFVEFLKENKIFSTLLTPPLLMRMVIRTLAGIRSAIVTLTKCWPFTTCRTGTPGR